MKFICSLITVEDINRSREFYETLLEQKVKYDFGENITFHGDFAIHLQSHYQTLIDNRAVKTGGNNFELYFETDAIEPMVERLQAQGVLFVHELREQPWRQKVVRFYDPDKNIVELGESMEHLIYRLQGEGLPFEQIAKITNLPLNFVSELLKKNP